MTIRKMYEKVCLVLPLEERRFFNYFEDSVNELILLLGDEKYVFEKDKTYTPPENLNDDNVVLPLYHNPIIDNILYLAGVDDAYKGEFIRKAKLAHSNYWSEDVKGRRIKRMRW